MFIKPPVKPWTPPIQITKPKPPRKDPPEEQTPAVPAPGTGSGSGSGHSGTGGSGGGHSGTGGSGGGHSGTGGSGGGHSGTGGSGGGHSGTGGSGGGHSGTGGSGGGHSGTGGSGSGGSTATQPQLPIMEIPSIETLFAQMLSHYLPETVEFTPIGEDILRETIVNWLRPAYEEAIRNRRRQTERINAELDADAWSRGMGQSTYLTDVKERQYRGEAEDVNTLESDYASSLASHLYDAMEEQQKQKIAVDEFNAEQVNHAHEQAMQTAEELHQAYLSAALSPVIAGTGTGTGGSGGSGGGHGGHAPAAEETAEETEDTSASQPSITESILHSPAAEGIVKTDYRTAANLVARMSARERSRLYNRADPAYLRLRAELIYSLGNDGFARLMREFPGA